MDNTKNLTTGGVLGLLIRFAIPVLAAMFLQSLYGGVDLLVAGQFAGTADVSGVSTGSLLIYCSLQFARSNFQGNWRFEDSAYNCMHSLCL